MPAAPRPPAPPTPPTVAIVTLGCKLNQADSDRLTEAFQARGFLPVAEDQPADAVVVNTCTVTHVADRKSRQLLRRARRLNRHAVVAAVGCYPAVAPAALRAMPEVDLVLGTRDKLLVVEQVAQRLARPAATPLDAPAPTPARALTRAMVKIEEGCDARCTFCIIPRARGELTSLPADAIVAEVRRLAADHHEVVLTGTNVGRYGYEVDRRRRLPELLRRVLDETPVRRLRLTSVEPSDLTPELLALWRDQPRLARHFHLALQSGSDPVLRAMRRRYNTAQFARAVARLRAVVPEVAITTDIIGGFPGETEADHAATLAFARAMAFSRIHVFPYSPRRGTPAAALPDQVPEAVRERRCAELRALGAELAAEYHRRWLGRTVAVLWEEPVERRQPAAGSQQWTVGDGPSGIAIERRRPEPATASADQDATAYWSGHTDTYIRVVAAAPVGIDLTGRATEARLVTLAGDAVAGELLPEEAMR
jgi:threonylcarbamoyladenosine tRNA methylthiotransferase MtaB